MTPTLRGVAVLVVALGLAVGGASSGWLARGGTLPDALGDREFWNLVELLSEPDGYFQSDNLVGNEHSYQWVVPALARLKQPNQVYLGVAPDQNFTYIAALQPEMAFIVDIRRGNLLTHLMYKVIFELSEDRADFVAFLFSRPRPSGLAIDTPLHDILAAVSATPRDELEFRNNLLTIQHHLTVTRGFTLSDEDLRGLDEIYSRFSEFGPALSYSSRMRVGGVGGVGGRRGLGNRFPSWSEMALQVDGEGRRHGYLASHEHFATIRQMQLKNLIVPVVGDHTGPKALRDVGRYIREHGATVGAFYTSNVEQYLFRYGTWPRFVANLGTLPMTDRSVIIRSVSPRDGYYGLPQGPDGRANVLDRIRPLVQDFGAGRIDSYRDVTGRTR